MRVVFLKVWTCFPLMELQQTLLRRKTHVHEFTVSPLWHRRLSLCPTIFRTRRDHLSDRTTPGTAALFAVRFRGGLGPGRRRAVLSRPAHRQPAHLPGIQGAARSLLHLRQGPPSESRLRRPLETLHPFLRTLCS